MVLDSSAIIAILMQEPGSDDLIEVMESSGVLRLSAATLVETAIVMQARFGDAGERELDVLLHRIGVDVVPLSPEQAEIARSAYGRFGKGRHTAALNFGDCFPYALAACLGEPLLFTGNDFSQTDVTSAL